MANRTRTHQIKVRLSDAELAVLKDRISQSGLSQQEFLVAAALNIPINITVTDSSEIRKLLPELKRQGNNLNQLTKKLHETGYVDYHQELPAMQKELNDIWQLLKQYLQKQA